jgi:hypothetical protein
MKNVTHKIEGKKLTITIDLEADQGPSKSGKTQVVATTEGNMDVPGFPGFKLGINLYKPLPVAPKA